VGLSQFQTNLSDPQAFAAAKAGPETKSKMAFKLPEEAARQNVIAYLATLK